MANQNLGSLQPVHNIKPYKHAEGTHQIEHFFRVAAGLDVDKEDIKRYYEFVEEKMRDLLLMAQRCAKANDRIRVEPRDLPITKGMQEYSFLRGVGCGYRAGANIGQGGAGAADRSCL